MPDPANMLEVQDGKTRLLDGIGIGWVLSAILDMHGGSVTVPEDVFRRASLSYQVDTHPGKTGTIVVTKVRSGTDV